MLKPKIGAAKTRKSFKQRQVQLRNALVKAKKFK